MADEDFEEEDAGEAAEADEEAASEDGDEAGEEGAKKRFGLKKLLMFGAPVLLLLGGGGFFLFTQTGLLGSAAEDGSPAKAAVFYDLPEMVVNLSAAEDRGQYLKLKVSLEADDKKVIAALEPVMPRVLDLFQLYLRELRSTDLDGSAGIFRLKEELMRRINIELHPNRINRVLFKEIIIQ